MIKLLQVAQLGQPILWFRAKDVKDVRDPKLQTLIGDLIASVIDVDM